MIQGRKMKQSYDMSKNETENVKVGVIFALWK